MKVIVILAMHGAPPNDFPKHEMEELFNLHSQLEQADEKERDNLKKRHDELDAKIRFWPRTPENDPFWTGSHEMARQLRNCTPHEVIVGFNEFCAPSIVEAIDQAAEKDAEKIIVVTPMMTRGGEHSEKDIPQSIQIAKERYPKIPIIYAWPFNVKEVAEYLALQVEKSDQLNLFTQKNQ